VTIDAGGLITIGSVANNSAIGLMNITGGSIDIGSIDTLFIANITTTLGDLTLDTLTTPTSARLISAGAMTLGTATTGSFSATSVSDLTIDTLNANGLTFFTSGGTLTYDQINNTSQVIIDAVDAIEGGDIATTGLGVVQLESDRIDIGDIDVGASGAISLISNVDSVTAGDLNVLTGGIVVESADTVDVGNLTSNSTSRITSVSDVSVNSIDAGGSTIVNTGGNLVAGDLISRTNSPGLTVTVAGDADIASAAANGLLGINVGGALTGGDFTGLGANSLVTINGGSVDIGSAESINQSVVITASAGDAVVDTASAGRDVTITGENVTLNNSNSARGLTLNATDGSVNGSGTLTISGVANFDATQDVNLGALTAGGVVFIDAVGNITSTGTNVTGTAVNLNAGGNVTANDLVATLSNGNNTVAVNAGGTVDLSSVTAANNIDIDAASIDVGTLGSIVMSAAISPSQRPRAILTSPGTSLRAR